MIVVSYTVEAVVRQFSLAEAGTVDEGTIFVQTSSVADGICIDARDNLYVAM